MLTHTHTYTQKVQILLYESNESIDLNFEKCQKAAAAVVAAKQNRIKLQKDKLRKTINYENENENKNIHIYIK